ncbi:hypothetical protein [uncultured Marivirga sp.]|uniref:hypothetical protein n=1 Tax=uncultured Marivirga sp. TaxID=1123707 RepID=UPI0030EE8ECB|tara:strand:- start:9307 stop:10335 length:1029 start_codon:yes stop_codon:yes gene_type:complete
MNRRILAVTLLLTLIILTGTGLVMYFTPFQKRIASIHTVFALLFMLAILFHMVNNKLPLKNYLIGKRLARFKKFQVPLIILVIVLLTTGLYHEVPVLNSLYSYGNALRNQQAGKSEENFDYQIIEVDKALGKHRISVELKKGVAFQYPLFAIWAEDTLGNYIETLYISRVIASSTFDYGVKEGDEWKASTKRRPEALPRWSHQRGVVASDGLYVPIDNPIDLDGVSGATPTSNFVVNVKSDLNSHSYFKIFLEVNQSYDWNDYYSKDKFPNDKIYSGDGKVGQPSLVYEAIVNQEELISKSHKIMKLVGHGHHSGKDGTLYKDLSQITTAKNIIDRIILTIE